MSFRIDHTYSGSEIVLNIAGHLSGVAVQDFHTLCNSIEGRFVVDLSGLVFADDKGIATLQAIAKRGGQIRGASPFIALLLDHGPHDNSGSHHQNQSTWD